MPDTETDMAGNSYRGGKNVAGSVSHSEWWHRRRKSNMWPGRGTVQSSMIPFGNCSLHSSCNSLLTRLLLLLYGAGWFLDCMEMCSTLLALPPHAVFCLQAQAVRAARFAGECRVSVYISARLLPSHVKCCFRWCHTHTAAKAFITIAFSVNDVTLQVDLQRRVRERGRG